MKRLRDRTFGFALGAVFGLIALLSWWLVGRIPNWAVFISGGLLLVATIAPGILLPINRMWSWLGHGIGSLFNHVVLSLFFYGVMVPFGGFARLFGKSKFPKRPEPERDSYWTPVERQTTPETYSDMF